MGFYGNITNTSRTQFQFDRVYANRVEMDEGALTDGIFMNRYVLIEYDSKVNTDTMIRVQLKNDQLYYNPTGKTDYSTLLTKSQVKKNDIVYSYDNNLYTFYLITSNYQADSSSAATFKEIVSGDESSPNYVKNYNIDINVYGAGRGYDSTVWQKTYVNNIEKYVMIAELNSVVPTFDVSADAPTTEPMVPHFDTQSTDLYYKLHWQAPWGMRVKQAADSSQSDETTSYTKYTYNPDTGTEIESSSGNYPADIYYNKAGFDITQHNESNIANKITIAPTGKSGNLYNKHNGTAETVAKNDIQEVSIVLPAIGNAICKVWDAMYSAERNRDVAWKYNGSGADSSLGGMTRDLTTVAGCINSVHDLMGMIIYTNIPSGLAINETEYNKRLIYYNTSVKKYYRIEKYITYVKATGSIVADMDYYIAKDKTTLPWKMEKANGNLTNQDIYIKDGYGYRLVELPGLGNNLNTIYGLILELRNLLEVDNKNTRNTETVQGCINTLNDIINNFASLKPGEFLICNNEGKISSASWTTKQDYIYTNEGTGNTSTISSAENQWINLSVNSTTKKITLTHKAHTANNTITKEDKNDISNTDLTIKLYSPIVDNCGHIVGKNTKTVTLPCSYKTVSSNYISDTTDDFYTKFKTDNTGSYIEAPSEKAVAPATTLKDTIQINTQNKWIQTKIKPQAKAIEFAHEVHFIDNEETTTNCNSVEMQPLENKVNSIVTYDIEYDKAGHLTKRGKHIWNLPNNFKTIQIGTQSTAVTNPAANTTSIVAKNSLSAFTLSSGNKWLRLNGDNANNILTIGHEVHSISTTKKADSDINGNGDTITVQDLTFDEAGHVTANQKHTYTLPYGFKTIKITNSTAADNAVSTINANGQIADNTQDTLTFAASNKWIKLDNNTEDTVKIGHNVSGFEAGAANTDYGLTADKTLNETDNSFNVPMLEFDEAGHIIKAGTNTVSIPNGLQKISVSNTGSQKVVTNTGAASGNLTAGTVNDTVTIDNGNRWITLVADSDNKKLTIYHNAPGNEVNTTQTGNETPSFGGTFSIPEIKYDEAGHISKVSTHTVTIPATLNGYSKRTVATAIAETDTLNSAFSKLENQIANETTNRASAINSLKCSTVGGGTNEYISSISQTNGIISATKTTLPDYSTYWTRISTLENTISTLQKTIEDLTSRIEALEKS